MLSQKKDGKGRCETTIKGLAKPTKRKDDKSKGIMNETRTKTDSSGSGTTRQHSFEIRSNAKISLRSSIVSSTNLSCSAK